jgi:tagaturonate reductase
MKTLNKETHTRKKVYPTKAVQFGEGNFLRCFVDWIIDRLNRGTDFNTGVTLLRPINTEMPPSLNTQDGLYTAIIRGINEKGELVKDYTVIESVNNEIAIYKEFDAYLELAKNPELRYIFSNTTEAGIAYNDKDRFEDRPQSSFPGKLTRFLFERYSEFAGDKNKGLIIIPCELIDYNGEKLKEIVLKYADLWNLEEGFKVWLEDANTWCSTLVDRIVTGFPWDEREALEKELGYKDNFMVTGEYFYLFVIQGPKWLEEEFKLNELPLNVKIVDDIKPYKMRKVAILNGAHTAMVPVSYLYGNNTVLETMETPVMEKFIKELIFDEIIPTLDMDKEELVDFANSVINRFKNPYIKHQLMSISLNSMFKFKTRLLPELLIYVEREKKLPKKIVFALAALICFYRGIRGEEAIALNDDKEFLDIYADIWTGYNGSLEEATEIGKSILGLENHWEANLLNIDGLVTLLGTYIHKITTMGMKDALEEVQN